MTFGTKLRKHREKRRLSQREVAEQLDIAQATYCNWEMDVSSCRVDYLPKLAQVLDVDIMELLPEGTVVKVMNNQNQKNHDTSVVGFEVTMSDSRALYVELLSSKDEIIRLLKEENAQTKARNTQYEDERASRMQDKTELD